MSAIQTLVKTFGKIKSDTERSANEAAAGKQFSIDGCKIELSNILEASERKNFEGFSNKFKKVANLFKTNEYAPFRGPQKNLSSFYYDVYEKYIN
jgi:endo-1,4-beta-D-glucanase Y